MRPVFDLHGPKPFPTWTLCRSPHEDLAQEWHTSFSGKLLSTTRRVIPADTDGQAPFRPFLLDIIEHPSQAEPFNWTPNKARITWSDATLACNNPPAMRSNSGFLWQCSATAAAWRWLSCAPPSRSSCSALASSSGCT